ncbi:MAG: phenylalanine--tRNA ligase subunit beta [Candidatus Hinthialibacter antarcticus]|nr:phenylalanine--tRNA ligase subunit beta [Candidatus Hinthialibacter antarcticus]
MKLPYSWLAELVEGLPTPDELADVLTLRGFEVEEMTSPGAAIRDVVVAKLLETAPHPDADKLTLCKVDDGSVTHDIVCGAKNMKPGDCVALARVGTVLPGDFKIEKRKIRGQKSAGMMCSKRELGLGDDHAGILILPSDAPLGQPLIEYMGMNDVIYDLGITPNRPDVLSAVGMAREVAAACGKSLKMPDVSPIAADVDADYRPSITLEDEDLCPRYTGIVMRGIKIGPSPEWLKARLEACGVRSINAVVDATNLVLLELGQPLHAFDLKKLKGEKIVVRRAKPNEIIKTLDEAERKLSEEMLVIADAETPSAVAGVMGGFDSEVTEQSTDILIESAYFHPPSIRRTSKTLGLSSEASYRFERGVDFDMVVPAAWRCAHLIAELAGGKVAGEITVADTQNDELLEPLRERTLSLKFAYCDKLLGTPIDPTEIESIFDSLNLKKESRDAEQITVRIPTYRKDIQRQADLVEEVARCHGYNKFAPTLPLVPLKTPEPQEIDRQLIQKIKEYLNGAGLDEAVTYSFTNETFLEPFPPADVSLENDACTILNAINSSECTMRTSMVPSLLQAVKRNVSRGNTNFGLFEIARTYTPHEGHVHEKKTIAGAIVGPLIGDWRNHKTEFDFFDLKGLVDGLLQTAKLTRYRLIPGPNCLHPHRGVWVQAGKQPFGYFGELHPSLAEKDDLSGRVCVFEFELAPMSQAFRKPLALYKPFSIYPAVERDLAFLLPDGVTAQAVEKVVQKQGGALLESVALFDHYRGKQVAEGFASVAFRLTFRSPSETLKEETVDGVCRSILDELQKKLNVQLRS